MSEEKKNLIHLHAITGNEDKNMANGMRNTKGTPLNDREIEYVKSEIRRIQADEKVFVFNDHEHMHDSICYNFEGQFMDTTIMNERLQEISSNPIMLAKIAKKEIRITGVTNVRCPKCGGLPEITTTSRGERTIVSCDCGYVHDVEINF